MFNVSANLNRRRLLLGLASASVAGAAIVTTATQATSATISEGRALLDLGDALPAFVTDHAAAEAAYWSVVEKWEPKWPVAPAELALRGYDSRRLERGLRGFTIRPDGKHDNFPTGGRPQVRSIETSADILSRINILDGYVRRLRPKHPLTANDLALIATQRDQLTERLAIAGRYEKACRDVLKRSGYEAADTRLKASCNALMAHTGKIMGETPVTMAGVMIQAEALEAFWKIRLAPLEVSAWGWPRLFAANLLRIAREAHPEQA